MNTELSSRYILGMRADATSYKDAADRVIRWAFGRESRYVCVAPVHTVMESYDSDEFRQVVNNAALVTPDGVPVVLVTPLARHPGRDAPIAA